MSNAGGKSVLEILDDISEEDRRITRTKVIVHLRDPHSDPLSNTIDPAKPLGEPAALKAFETFPESVALLKILDGTFIVVYPEDTDCLELMDIQGIVSKPGFIISKL